MSTRIAPGPGGVSAQVADTAAFAGTDGTAAALVRMGLLTPGEEFESQALTGGVSSDIHLIRTGSRAFVLKRALEKLKVAADWRAPLDRVASEAAWLEYAGGVVPGSCPRVLAFDGETFTMALEYLDPGVHLNWKSELLAGRVDPEVAASVASRLGRIHAASARQPELADRFANADLFESLRIEPYLVRAGAAVPEAREPLGRIIAGLRETRIGLVHGDVSPKNILVGGDPVLLDAECATWGDPAFDAAFCLTHLTLKRLHLPAHAEALAAGAREFESAYLAEVDWEDQDAAASRIARIVPALLLARVAGASPVEYLDDASRAVVRDIAIDALRTGTPADALITEREEASR